MGMYFDNSKRKKQPQSNLASELSFSTATGTASNSSKAASTTAVIFCALAGIALPFFGFLALMFSIGAMVSAASGFPAAKRDGRLGVAGGNSQIVVLTFLLLLGFVLLFLSLFLIWVEN